MIRTSCLQFLLVVAPAASWMHAAFAASVLIGAVTLWLNPKDVDSAFGSLLLLQMFSSSSGFGASASKGYFDPLLTGEQSRARVAIGSLIASTLPGIAAWTATALIAAVLGQPAAAFAVHRLAALGVVSAIAWAGGLALPRMAAGALWSFALLGIALSRGAAGQYLIAVQSIPADAPHVVMSAGIFAVCPFLLLGDFAAAGSAPVIVIDMCLALAAAWCGVRYLTRREYSLMEQV
jgi:hypothetical protein